MNSFRQECESKYKKNTEQYNEDLVFVVQHKDYLEELLKQAPIGLDLKKLTWSSWMAKVNSDEKIEKFKQKLSDFRNKLIQEIQNKICTGCVSYGSTNRESNVNVTVQYQDVTQRALIFTRVRMVLQNIFLALPGAEEDTALQMGQRLFDINFYLSDFAILKGEPTTYNDASMINIDDYYVSLDLVTQLGYALWTDKMLVSLDPGEDIPELTYEKYYEALEKMRNLTQGPSVDENILINQVSNISTYEDECYHTQGSFFHVVMMMQRRLNFTGSSYKLAFLCFMSMIENLAFARMHINHGRKVGKYINRVMDAASKFIQYYKECKKLSLSPDDEKNVNKMTEWAEKISKDYMMNKVLQMDMKKFAKKVQETLAEIGSEFEVVTSSGYLPETPANSFTISTRNNKDKIDILKRLADMRLSLQKRKKNMPTLTSEFQVPKR